MVTLAMLLLIFIVSLVLYIGAASIGGTAAIFLGSVAGILLSSNIIICCYCIVRTIKMIFKYGFRD